MPNYKVVDAGRLDAAMTATADSIRAKTGGTSAIPWDSTTGFKTAVEAIQTGGGTAEPPNIQPLTVTENGTYTASGDVDGYSPIVVNVPSSGDSGAIETCELTIRLQYAPNAYINYIWFASENNGILRTVVIPERINNNGSVILLVAVDTPVTIRCYDGGGLVRTLSGVNTEILYEDYNNTIIVKCTKSGSASLIIEGIDE